MKKRALISVSDKAGVIDFARGLAGLGYEIISTGGTQTALEASGIKTINISEVTGFRECLDGRVKTLHPAVHAGLLAMRSNPTHMAQLSEMGYSTIDVVAVNLYPFKQTIAHEGVTMEDAIENIDIGGPTMLRSAAKNYQDVLVIVDPNDYDLALEKLTSHTDDKLFHLNMMYKVFQYTAQYDSLIANFFREKLGIEYPDYLTLAYEKGEELRYGENPHQTACVYKEQLPYKGSLATAKQLHGKELSFNNYNDANGAVNLLREFSEPTVVAVKHTNPCGVASADDIFTAYEGAYNCDPMSIFGGIVVANREIDEKTAKEMVKIFLEIIIAPSFTPEALKTLKVKANLRLLELPDIATALPQSAFEMKKIEGGLLVQSPDRGLYNDIDVKVVTKTPIDEKTMEELKFCYTVVKHAKSNAIAISVGKRSLGIGVGQTNRIWATKQAIEHAGDRVKGSVLASDAYFPFSDCVEECAKAGIKAIIQPGGSKNDQLSIDACDEAGIGMVFVGNRHFKH